MGREPGGGIGAPRLPRPPYRMRCPHACPPFTAATSAAPSADVMAFLPINLGRVPRILRVTPSNGYNPVTQARQDSPGGGPYFPISFEFTTVL